MTLVRYALTLSRGIGSISTAIIQFKPFSSSSIGRVYGLTKSTVELGYSSPSPPKTMDVVINPSSDQIRINSHNTYQAPDALSPETAATSPIDQFHSWFADAVRDNAVHEPEAVSLSTATREGIPSARMVLFKQLDEHGAFVFFTNYTSRKSREIEANPHAAMVFYWREIHRSVRVMGRVEKVNREESEAYFRSRPVGSRLGAWASNQSQVVGEGEVHARLEEIKERFGVQDESVKEADIPLPDFWGGWRLIPKEIEFWAGRPSRLHDRVRYLRVEGSSDDVPEWRIDRLAP